MSEAVFDIKEINQLMAEFQGSVTLKPTLEQQFNPELYKDGVLRDIDGRSRSQAEEQGRNFWPDISLIIQEKIPKVLVLKANDKGIYLTTNVKAKLNEFQRGAVVFAKGCNPVKDDYWEETAHRITKENLELTVPIGWVVSAIRAKSSDLRIEIDDEGKAQVAA